MILLLSVLLVVICLLIVAAVIKVVQKIVHMHKKGRCMDKKPSEVAKIGDRVRILKGYSISDHVGKTGTVTDFWSDGDAQVILDNGKETIASKVEVLQPAKEQSMTQRQFKAGDRVRVKTGLGIKMFGGGKEGVVVKDDLFGSRWTYEVKLTDGHECFFNSEHLERQPKTLDTLTEGDVVVDKDDDKHRMTILHVLKPGLYVTSDKSGMTLLNSSAELEELNYRPLQETQDDATSLTVAEVARKLGLDPDKLKIVAEKDGDD